MVKSPAISLIVPIYNVADFLSRTLESVKRQTFTDFEALCINDGSKDTSADIVKSFADTDERFKLINQDNAGLSGARNTGLKNARGEYIMFLDGDDYMHKQCMEIAYNTIKKTDTDICVFGYSRVLPQENMTDVIYDKENALKYIENPALYLLKEFPEDIVLAWNKIYKREVVKNIRFDSRFKINEDVLFNYYAFKNAKKTIYIDSCFYIYHVEETSACKNTAKLKNAEDCYLVSQIMQQESIGTAYEELASMRFLNNKINLYRTYKNYAEKRDTKRLKELKQSIKEDMKRFKLGKNQKVSAFLIVHFGPLYVFMYNIYDRLRTPNWDV